MYVLARTRSSRPSLMHRVSDSRPRFTLCGVSLWGWSCAYLDEAIPQVYCQRCRKAEQHL